MGSRVKSTGLIYILNLDRVLTPTVSPSGFGLPTPIPFQPYTKSSTNLPQRPGRRESVATTELLLHSSAHPKLDYTVRDEDTLQKHYVGVYDPETGTLEVTQARKMEVRAAVRAHQDAGEQVHQVSLRPGMAAVRC
jgi:DNA-directed RNA polymerase I subunit RPA49